METVGVVLEKREIAQLRALAEKQKRSLSSLARQFICAGLEIGGVA